MVYSNCYANFEALVSCGNLADCTRELSLKPRIEIDTKDCRDRKHKHNDADVFVVAAVPAVLYVLDLFLVP